MRRLCIIIVLLLIFSGCSRKDEYLLRVFPDVDIENTYDSEKLLISFIENYMTSPNGGIYTNIKDSNNIENLPKGHEVLSESVGIYMLYLSSKGDKEKFDKQLEYFKNYFLMKGVVSWRIKEGKYFSSTGAVIDDLRIVKSLFIAYDKWMDPYYMNMIEMISNVLLKSALVDNMIVNDYGSDGSGSTTINLSYIDLYTIKRLGEIDNKWNKVFDRSLKIIKNGNLEGTEIFYYFNYDLSNDSYYVNKNRISVLDSFLVNLHLSEIGILSSNQIKWFNDFKSMDVYSYYDIYSNEFVSNIESTSIYSVLARILVLNGIETYEELEKKIESFQIGEGPYIGGYGNELKGEFFSFDNLNALIYYIVKGR